MANFTEKLNKKILMAQKIADKNAEKAVEKLLDNKSFIEAQRQISAKQNELNSLNETVIQLNGMKPFVAKDGRRFNINVFPINVFGTGLGSVIGIINGSRNAFIDEKALEYSAICGISTLELIEANTALGNPSYFKDGKVNDAIIGDYSILKDILTGILIKLGLNEISIKDFTREKYDLYFSIAETKALRQQREHDDLQTLETNSKNFVLED